MKFVKAIVDKPNEYDVNGHIRKYGLVKDKIYKVADNEDIAPSPNSNDFIFIYQFNGRVIPYLPKDFMSMEDWREEKLNELI